MLGILRMILLLDENNKLYLRLYNKNGEPDYNHKITFFGDEWMSQSILFLDAVKESKVSHILD